MYIVCVRLCGYVCARVCKSGGGVYAYTTIPSGNLNNGRMSAWRAESVFYIRMAQLEEIYPTKLYKRIRETVYV